MRRPRLIFRWKYRLYYSLELFFGARKQIFLTFGPWVLIKVYHLEAKDIAGLYMIAAAIGLVIDDSVAMVASAGQPTATFHGPAEAVIRLIGGRLKPEHTSPGTTVTGNITLEDLRRVFPGYSALVVDRDRMRRRLGQLVALIGGGLVLSTVL